MPPVDAPMLGDGVAGMDTHHHHHHDDMTAVFYKRDNDDGDHVLSSWNMTKRPRSAETKKEEEEREGNAKRLRLQQEAEASKVSAAASSTTTTTTLVTTGDASALKRDRTAFSSSLTEQEAAAAKRARISLSSTTSVESNKTTTSSTKMESPSPPPPPHKYYQSVPTPFHHHHHHHDEGARRRYSDSHASSSMVAQGKALILPSRHGVTKTLVATPSPPPSKTMTALTTTTTRGKGAVLQVVEEEDDDDDDDDDEHFYFVSRLRRWGFALWSGVDSACTAVTQFRRRLLWSMMALRLGFVLLLIPSVVGLAVGLALTVLFLALRLVTLGQVETLVDASRLTTATTRAVLAVVLCCLSGLLSPAFGVFGLLAALSQCAVEVAEPLLEMQFRSRARKLQHLYALVTDPVLLESVGTVLHATQVVVEAGAQATEVALESTKETSRRALELAEDSWQEAGARVTQAMTRSTGKKEEEEEEEDAAFVVAAAAADPKEPTSGSKAKAAVAAATAVAATGTAVAVAAAATTTAKTTTATSARPKTTTTTTTPAVTGPAEQGAATTDTAPMTMTGTTFTSPTVVFEFSKESTQALVQSLWTVAGRTVAQWGGVLQRRLPGWAYDWMVEQVQQFRESGVLEVAAARLLQVLHQSEHFMGGALSLLPYVKAVQQVRRTESAKRRRQAEPKKQVP